MDEGAHVTLDLTGRQIHLANGILLKMTKNCEQGLLEFRGNTWRESTMTASAPLLEGVDEEFEQTKSKLDISKQQIWHKRLGHPGRAKSRAILHKLEGEHIVDLDPDTALTCEQCIQSKKYTCTLVLVDDHSKYVYVQPILQKGHASTQLKRIITFLETQTGRKLKAICSDQGTEWKSNDALEWTHSKGVEWQTMRKLPKTFWPFAMQAAAFKMNLTPSVDDEFPYQTMFGKPPGQFMSLIWVFSCLTWVNVPKPPPALVSEEELDNLGYMEENIFDEKDQEPLNEYILMEPAIEMDEKENIDEEEEMPNAETWTDTTPFGLAVADINKKRNLGPTVSKALAGEDRKHWEEVMQKELDGLEAMDTWKITELPQGMNTVDTRWVLKIKMDVNLIPTNFKARLVV
ncbi:uncharacterized protein UBRO_20518 [Ustilago bromivora]|uniref:Uncharacterized protein n=1 Tax=Ustilago bromivora TaxID=307758 RepID=A0A1K0FZ28_9BASI|nr:uncharacterized protein UBRO_20518 [Ustilago bromivora]